jgi:hypothetical protein
MTVYVIYIRDAKGEAYMPELTCDFNSAKKRRKELNDGGYPTMIAKYEVKTQGKNFSEVSTIHSVMAP